MESMTDKNRRTPGALSGQSFSKLDDFDNQQKEKQLAVAEPT